jgi:aldehyde dehydrogenase (NAD+)
VNQEDSEDDTQHLNMLTSSRGSVVGIVDRTANLEEAAEALLTARFGFGGKSPYVPDIVLVNEFIKKDFLNALVRKSIDFMTERSSNGVLDDKNPAVRRIQNPAIDLSALTNLTIITSNSSGTIAEITDRYLSSPLTQLPT